MLKLEVVSGGLSGRTFQFEKTEVRLGRHPACEIAFDSLRDDSVGRWHAHIRPEGNAWSIENLHENGTLLNGKPVTGKLLIQSGDSFRLARDGPEIRVTIVQQGSPTRSPMGPGAESLGPHKGEAQRDIATPSSRSSASISAWVAVGALSIATLALAMVLWRPKLGKTSDRGHSQAGTESSRRTESGSSPSPLVPRQEESVAEPTAEKPASRGRESEATDPWQVVEQRTRQAMYALAVEEPKGLGIWPMGAACAVRGETLVTTASVATQLETLRREKWKIWALGATPSSTREITNVQVHIGFVKSADKPKQQAFFDLALLTLNASVVDICTIASDEELKALDGRKPFGCLAISLPAEDPKDPPEPMGRFDVLVPELIKGKVQGLLQLSGDPGAPQMLLLPASMPSQIWGSPVLNETGNLIAVCTEASQKTDTGTVRLNYAPVVSSIADWLQGRGLELWVPVPAGTEMKQP